MLSEAFEKSLFASLFVLVGLAFSETRACEYANCPKTLKIAIIVKIIRFKDVSFFIS